MPGATIDTLQIAGDPERWRELGFRLDSDPAHGEWGATCQLGATTLRFGKGAGSAASQSSSKTPRAELASDEQAGIVSWTLSGSRGSGPVDGLSTVHRIEAQAARLAAPPKHPNSAQSVDHVVVATPDLERTLEAIDAAGMHLRRTRESASGVRQAFFRHGEVILEVVGPAQGERDPNAGPAGPASFWGLVVAVRDIDLAAQIAGAHLGPVKDAVQPGRRIATVAAGAGLSVRLALISS